MYSATKQTGVVLFEISGLEQGTHTLTFESIRDDAGRAKTSFDYLKVLEGETIDWNPTVESEKVKFEGSWARWDRAANNENDADSWFGKDEVYVDVSLQEQDLNSLEQRAADWASSNTK